ncbi:tetratricopeptide repeat protein [Desulfococcaceae bacterium HSG7]|nr:tetratricopeptide repeat protein [Desulfococcaceae bacterium HSG7]
MNSRLKKEVLICLFIIISTMTVYWQVRNYAFVFDDDLYVAENPHVLSGLCLKNIVWSFTAIHSANWHPLTWLSHAADITLWGLNPGAHHVTNIFFHIINALLLFYIFKGLTDDLYQSGFVAMLFALHPLHVESVAWVAERKDLLCALFWILTIHSYIRYVKYPCVKRYLPVFIFYTLSLLSKPMAVTLPFVLLLLDYWPLNRLDYKKPEQLKTGFLPITYVHLIYEKLPLFALTLCSSIITYFAQQSGGAVVSLNAISFGIRIQNALVSYNSYVSKLFWPYPLAVLYPHEGMPSVLSIVSACILLIFTSFFVIRLMKHHPYLLVGWLWFIGTLIPVIGIVQVGLQSMADRYSYLPSIGLSIMIAWGVPELLKKWRYKKQGIITILAISFTLMMWLTWKQVQHWKDSITLFQHAINVTADNELAHYNLGLALSERGRHVEALYHHNAVLRLKPDNVNALNNAGIDFEELGMPDKAIQQYARILELKPQNIPAYVNMGNVMITKGKIDEAIVYYHKALRFDRNNAKTHNNLGVALLKKGQFPKAIASFRQALIINPGYIEASDNLKASLTLLDKEN